LALSLLFEKKVASIWLNDLDPAIFACWHSILTDSERFCEKLNTIPLTVEEWQKQKRIYKNGHCNDMFDLGFSTFFLNRTNHSGILNGGLIGGKSQKGAWKLDARFNRAELIRRVRRVAESRSQIKLTCVDAARLVRALRANANCLVYLDPPYVSVGKALYLNAYTNNDHSTVRNAVQALRRRWIVSYDDLPLTRRLYRNYRSRSIELLHTAREAKLGREVLFFSPECVIPRFSS
jgi:DNA adenine methylase